MKKIRYFSIIMSVVFLTISCSTFSKKAVYIDFHLVTVVNGKKIIDPEPIEIKDTIIYIDGKQAKCFPEDKTLTAILVPYGFHEIKIRKKGYKPISIKKQWKYTGREDYISAELEPER